MNTPTRDDLLGFVLGALEAEEHQRVADCLHAHPDLQLELQRIRALLAPLEWCQLPPAEFPVGLARRTCEIISRESRQAVGSLEIAASPRLSRAQSEKSQATPTAVPAPRRCISESAALVCCAALLGAALGPAALHLTRAVTSSPVAMGAIAAHRSESTKPMIISPIKSTSNPKAINDGDLWDLNAVQELTCEARFDSPLQQIELAWERQPQGTADAINPIPRSSSFISFCSQSLGKNAWDDSRSWSHDSIAESQESDVVGLLSQIGSRTLISSYSLGAFQFDVQPISN